MRNLALYRLCRAHGATVTRSNQFLPVTRPLSFTGERERCSILVEGGDASAWPPSCWIVAYKDRVEKRNTETMRRLGTQRFRPTRPPGRSGPLDRTAGGIGGAAPASLDLYGQSRTTDHFGFVRPDYLAYGGDCSRSTYQKPCAISHKLAICFGVISGRYDCWVVPRGLMEPFSVKQYVSGALIYGVVVAWLYLFGYWGAFNINFLEFVSLADFAKLAIYPLVGSFAVLLLGTALSEVTRGDTFPPGGGANTRLGRFGHKHWRFLVAVDLLLSVVIANFGSSPFRWFIVALLVGLLSTPLSHLNLTIAYLPNPRVRASILFLLLWIPCAAFAYGRIDAHLVKSGQGPLKVDAVRSLLPVTVGEKAPITYLGRLGEYFALYEATSQSVVFVKPKDDTPLFINPRPRVH